MKKAIIGIVSLLLACVAITQTSPAEPYNLEYRNFDVTYIGNHTVRVKYTLHDVVGVAQINFFISLDGGRTFKRMDVELAGNVQPDVEYTADIQYQ